jgi:hypothetical protein
MGFRNAGIGAIDFYVDGFLGRDRYAHGPAGAVARTRPKRAAHVGLGSSAVAATDRRGCICMGQSTAATMRHSPFLGRSASLGRLGFGNAYVGAIDLCDEFARWGRLGAVARTRPKRAAHVGLESSTVAATDRRGCICSGPAHGCHPHAPVCMGGLPAWAGWGCGNAYVAAIELCDEFRRQPVQRKRTQRPGCRCVGEVPAMADPRRVRMEGRQEFD